MKGFKDIPIYIYVLVIAIAVVWVVPPFLEWNKKRVLVSRITAGGIKRKMTPEEYKTLTNEMLSKFSLVLNPSYLDSISIEQSDSLFNEFVPYAKEVNNQVINYGHKWPPILLDIIDQMEYEIKKRSNKN